MGKFSKATLFILLQRMSTIDLALAYYCEWDHCTDWEVCCGDDMCCPSDTYRITYILAGIGVFLLLTCCSCCYRHRYSQGQSIIHRISNRNYVRIPHGLGTNSINRDQIHNPIPQHGVPAEQPRNPDYPPPYSEVV